ncbi:unnamed protein product [Caretta caretta]
MDPVKAASLHNLSTWNSSFIREAFEFLLRKDVDLQLSVLKLLVSKVNGKELEEALEEFNDKVVNSSLIPSKWKGFALEALWDGKLRNEELYNETEFVGPWFQKRLRPFLAAVSIDILQCLQNETLGCVQYQAIVKGLDLEFKKMSHSTQEEVYGAFQLPYLKGLNVAGSACVDGLNTSTAWLRVNFRNFSRHAAYHDFLSLNSRFNGLDVLSSLTVKQRAQLSATQGTLLTPEDVQKLMSFVTTSTVTEYIDELNRQIVNTMAPAALADLLSSSDFLNDNNFLTVLLKNYKRRGAFIDLFNKRSIVDTLPNDTRMAILAGVWPAVLRSDNETVVDMWLSARLSRYFSFTQGNILNFSSTQNASCTAFRKIVGKLSNNMTAFKVSQQEIYNFTKAYLTATSARPRCYDASDPRTANWFAAYLGRSVRYSSADDVRSFINNNATVLQDLAINPDNLRLLNHTRIHKDVAELYATALFAKNSNFSLVNLPDELLCFARRSTAIHLLSPRASLSIIARINLHCGPSNTSEIKDPFTTDHQLATMLVAQITPFDARTLAALGQQAVGLTSGQILELRAQDIADPLALQSLGQVNGWDRGQSQGLMNKLISSNFTFDTAEAFRRLGTLVPGLPSHIFGNITADTAMKMAKNANFHRAIKKAPSYLKRAFVDKIISNSSSLNDILNNVPDDLVDQVPVPLLVLRDELLDLRKINEKQWSPEQLSCMAKILAAKNLTANFTSYPPDVLLFFDFTQVQNHTCKEFYSLASQGNPNLLPNGSAQRTQLLNNALVCLDVRKAFFRSVVAGYQTQSASQKEKTMLLLKSIGSGSPSSPRSKRATEQCKSEPITASTIQDPLFIVYYDTKGQFDACLSNEVLKANLVPLLEHPLTEEYLDVMKSKLSEAKQLITRYTDLGGTLTGPLLQKIGGRDLCGLDDDQINKISSEAIGTAGKLDISSCSQSKKDRLYAKARDAFASQTGTSAYYPLIQPYLGGAPVKDLEHLAGSNIAMDIDTFTSLKPNELQNLSVQNVKNLLGVNLPDLNRAENHPSVTSWIQRHYQTELDSILGIGLHGGMSEPVSMATTNSGTSATPDTSTTPPATTYNVTTPHDTTSPPATTYNVTIPHDTTSPPATTYNVTTPHDTTSPPATTYNVTIPHDTTSPPATTYNVTTPHDTTSPPATTYNVTTPHDTTSPPATTYNVTTPHDTTSPPATTYNVTTPHDTTSPPATTYNVTTPHDTTSPPATTYNVTTPHDTTSPPATTYNVTTPPRHRLPRLPPPTMSPPPTTPPPRLPPPTMSPPPTTPPPRLPPPTMSPPPHDTASLPATTYNVTTPHDTASLPATTYNVTIPHDTTSLPATTYNVTIPHDTTSPPATTYNVTTPHDTAFPPAIITPLATIHNTTTPHNTTSLPATTYNVTIPHNTTSLPATTYNVTTPHDTTSLPALVTPLATIHNTTTSHFPTSPPATTHNITILPATIHTIISPTAIITPTSITHNTTSLPATSPPSPTHNTTFITSPKKPVTPPQPTPNSTSPSPTSPGKTAVPPAPATTMSSTTMITPKTATKKPATNTTWPPKPLPPGYIILEPVTGMYP